MINNLKNINFFDSYATVLKKLKLHNNYEAIRYIEDKNIRLSEAIATENNLKQIAETFKVKCKFLNFDDLLEELNKKYNLTEGKDKSKFAKRQLVVTIMGHVDHGKTTLLDKIRSTSVTSHEYGEITQKLGAYQVKKTIDKKEHHITFIDTPGHELFDDMRRRGIAITDIVVLLIAANSGIEVQTIEAIKQIQLVKVNLIVAFNKIDKGLTNLENIKNQLLSHGIVLQDRGGDIPSVELSAKTGKGVDELLETIALLDEVTLDVKGDTSKPAFGVVLESHIDRGFGVVATVLLKKGSISIGDYIVHNDNISKIRQLFIIEQSLIPVKNATIYQPIQIIGMSELPELNSVVSVFQKYKDASNYLNDFLYIKNKSRQVEKSIKNTAKKISFLEDSKVNPKFKTLKFVIKADASGILESIKEAIFKLKLSEDLSIEIVDTSIGDLNQGDINTILTTNSILLLFNIKLNKKIEATLEGKNISYYSFKQLYNLIEEVKELIKKITSREDQSINREGVAVVKKIFSKEKGNYLIGCLLLEGTANIRNKVELISKDNENKYQVKLHSLRSYKQKINFINQKGEFGALISFINITETEVNPQEDDKLFFYKK